MEIQGPGGISGPERIEPQKIPTRATEPSGEIAGAPDQVEISEEARLLEMLSHVPPVRAERIEELQRLIEAGEFETEDRIAGAVEKLMEEL